MPGHIVVTAGPVVRVLGTGPKERFAPTLEAVAITAGHEQRVSDGAAVAGRCSAYASPDVRIEGGSYSDHPRLSPGSAPDNR